MLSDRIAEPWSSFLAVDTEDVKYLGLSVPLDLALLRARYLEEVRPYLIGPAERGDVTIDLWCDAIEEMRTNIST